MQSPRPGPCCVQRVFEPRVKTLGPELSRVDGPRVDLDQLFGQQPYIVWLARDARQGVDALAAVDVLAAEAAVRLDLEDAAQRIVDHESLELDLVPVE